MSDNILVVKGVKKYFGGLAALNGVSLEVPRGKITLLIGPNGSGKTTLINVVSGYYKPDAGRVFFEGEDVTGRPPHVLYEKGMARTFQIPKPFHKLSVLENLMVAARGHPGESYLRALLRNRWLGYERELAEKAFDLLRMLNLDHLWDHPAGQLSGGQMKLLEAGRAIMSGARLLMMDEPAAGINPKLAHDVFRNLVALKERLGITFLIVEHRLDIAVQYVDYAYAMHRGVIISRGLPSQVLKDPNVIESYLGG